MKVLTVLPDVPLPPDTGLHLRMLGNLRLVKALQHESLLLFFSTAERQGHLELIEDVAALVDDVRHGGRRREQHEFGIAETLVSKGSFLLNGSMRRGGRVYPFSHRYDAIGGLAIVLKHARSTEPDVIIIPSFCVHWAPQLRAAGFAVIADAIDVLTDLTAELAKSYAGLNPVRRLSLLANRLASKSQEQLYLPACSEVWTTSPAEAARIRALAPGTPVVVVPNTVPDPGVALSPRNECPRIGFLGTYSSRPNLDAATRLVECIFPIVRQTVPDAVLRIAGAGLPARTAEAWQKKGVAVLGRIGSSTDFLASCDVVALPVTVRGGVPLKLVEAMALGRPVVAAPQLVAGVPVAPNLDLLVGRSDAEFAAAIVRLVKDDDLASSIGRAGRAAYVQHFSPAALERDARRRSLLRESHPRT